MYAADTNRIETESEPQMVINGNPHTNGITNGLNGINGTNGLNGFSSSYESTDKRLAVFNYNVETIVLLLLPMVTSQ